MSLVGRNRAQAAVIIGALMLVHTATSVAWLHADEFDLYQVQDSWAHTLGSIRLHSALRTGPLTAAKVALRERSSHYPLLAHFPAALAGLALGPTPTALRLGSLLYLALLLAAVYGIGRRCHSHRAGLLAAVLASFMPGIQGGLRTIGLDFPATSLTTVSIYCLIRTQSFCDLKRSALFGLAAALATLCKAQSVFFVIGPGIVVLGRHLLRLRLDSPATAPDTRRPLIGASLALAILLAGTAVWWGGRLVEIAAQLQSHTTGEGMLFFEDDTSVWGGIRVYAAAFPLLITGVLSVALLALLPIFFSRCPRHRWLLLVWIAAPVMLHVLLQVRHHRYLMPLVPALALVIAVGICALEAPRLRAGAALLVGASAVALWLTCTLVPGPSRLDGVTPHRSIPALQGSASVLSQLFTCGDWSYAGCPRYRLKPSRFLAAGEPVLRHLARRHPGGAGAALSFASDLGGSFHVVFYVQQRLPALLLRGSPLDPAEGPAYHLSTGTPPTPPAPGFSRQLDLAQVNGERLVLWARRPPR